jgi:hypothetical protein
MTEWQPIKTAPIDGTEILVTDGETVSTCFYFISDNPDYASFVRSSGGELIDISVSTYWNLLFKNPTHWMPMPTPPKVE